MEKKVFFYSEGCKLAGTLFVPDNLPPGQKNAAIIFCPGFTGIRDTNMLGYSRYLCRQGYVGLSLDYRGFGESEGTKWRLLPMAEVEDIRNAITFLQQQPEADNERLGLFGVSFGGAIATYVAAMDDRIKCVIATVSVGNGRQWLRGLRNNWEWKSFLDEVEKDRVDRVITGKSKWVDQLYLWPRDEKGKAFAEQKVKNNPDACTRLPLETAQAVLEFRPDEVARKVSPRPMLFIAAEHDVIAPPEFLKEVYDKAGEPKRFVVVPDATHYEMYNTEPYAGMVMRESLGWLNQYLPGSGITGEK